MKQRNSVGERIRQWFEGHTGAGTIEQVAVGCLQDGVFDEDWRSGAALRAAKHAVETALRARDEYTGLSVAAPSATTGSTGAAVWKNRSLFTKQDAFAEFDADVKSMRSDYAHLERKRVWIEETFGDAPPMPELLPSQEPAMV